MANAMGIDNVLSHNHGRLLRTCRQVYREAASLLYCRYTFIVAFTDDYEARLYTQTLVTATGKWLTALKKSWSRLLESRYNSIEMSSAQEITH